MIQVPGHVTKSTIVVGVDGSPACAAAIRWAAHEAVLHGLAITLLHVVVVGSRGLGAFRRHISGRPVLGCSPNAHCRVAVVHEPEPSGQPIPGDAPVLLGIDGSPVSEAATAYAFEEASRRGAALVALHA